MPMPEGGTKSSGTKGSVRKSAKIKASKVNRRTRSTVKALKHGTFAGSGYKTGKKR